MKTKELRELNKNELEKLLAEKQEAARKLRFDISSKQVKNHREYRNTRGDIARILTLLREGK
jgi:ribosomal protein L29